MGSVFDRLAGTKVGSRPVDGGHVGIDGGDAFDEGREQERRILIPEAAGIDRRNSYCGGAGRRKLPTLQRRWPESRNHGFCTEFSVTGCEKELLWLAAVVSQRVVGGGGEALRDGLIGVGEVGDEDQKQGGSAIREQ